MQITCEGKRAFVCGSTDGIGKACAIALAELGASITLIARNEQKLSATLKNLKTNPQQNHDFIVADFTEPDILKEKVDAYLSDGKIIHILINNTGGPPLGKAAIMTEVSDFITTLNQHLICSHILSQALVPGMIKAGYGRIINVTGTTAKQPENFEVLTNMLRPAVGNWAKTLANELGKHGITVNNVLPEYIATKRLTSFFEQTVETTGKSKESIVEEHQKLIPVGRFGEPKEVAWTVAFLASPLAAYINGINLPVDGGYLRSL